MSLGNISKNKLLIYFKFFSDLWSEPFADIHKVKGLQGIYIVSQISSSISAGNVDVGPEHIVTLITFDWGVDWRLLNITRAFSHCEKVIYVCLTYYTFQFFSNNLLKFVIVG